MRSNQTEFAMNKAEELLAAFDRRGLKIRRSEDGGLEAVPFSKLTPDDRAAIGEVAADKDARSTLVRLLCERESPTPGLSPADARMIHDLVETFDARVISVGPPRPYTPPSPVTGETIRPQDPDQLSLFPSHPTANAGRIAVLAVAHNDPPLELTANDPRRGGNPMGILQTQVIPVRPPLKWAGGKRWLVPRLAELWRFHHQRRLVEPFCGGLAATLSLRPKLALLNDINPHAINFYSWLKRGLVVDNRLELEKCESLYYQHRERFNDLISHGGAESSEAAALFYYLNRTCFNGLCRFNSEGQFNVPFGRYKQINYQRDFSEYRPIFAEWEISSGDFEQIAVEPSDFLYADPPYDVEFRSYSKEGFNWDDQIRLAEWAAKHPGPTVVSNQATDRILRLYKKLDFRLCLIDSPRRISCTGDRAPAKEMLAIRGFDSGQLGVIQAESFIAL